MKSRPCSILEKTRQKKKKKVSTTSNQIQTKSKQKTAAEAEGGNPNPCAKPLALGQQSESSVAVRYEEWAQWADDGQQQRPSFRYSIDHCHK